MSSTRFHDDPCRIQKQLQELTGIGRYMLNVPGNGDKPCFMEDPFIRMQKWGANLMTNTINLESDLLGLTRASTRDCRDENEYKSRAVKSNKINYPSCESITDQSRATHPAWMSRDLEQVDWYTLPLNPQENTCMRFQNNLSTRILERNTHVTKVPCLTPISPSESVNPNPFIKPLGTNYVQ
jgi:hypothetical protein